MRNPLTSTDRALVAYLNSQGVGTSDNVYPFKRSGSKAVPCVIVHSHQGRTVSPFCGTYEVDADIFVITTAAVDVTESDDGPIAENDDLVNRTYAALHKLGEGAQSTQQMVDAINAAAAGAAPEWSCQSFEITGIGTSSETPSPSITRAESDSWTDTVSVRMTVTESNLS